MKIQAPWEIAVPMDPGTEDVAVNMLQVSSE